MRTIECRGKDNHGTWRYGAYVAFDGLQGAIYYPIRHKETNVILRTDWVYVDDSTVGQFTGLKDKNGRKIYEGDIIRHSPNSDIYYIVEWHICELVAKQIGTSSYAGIAYWLDVTEVIGNIYDNPELLKCNITNRK